MANLLNTVKKADLKTSKRTAKKPTDNRKGGRLTKSMWKFVLKDAEELIDNNTWGDWSDTKLSKRWNVSRKTAANIREIVESNTYDDIPFLKHKFLKHFSNIEEDLSDMHNDLRTQYFCKPCEMIVEGKTKCPSCGNKYLNKNFKGKLSMAKEIPAYIKEVTDFLERWGDKEKVADKVDIQADVTQRSLNIEVVTNVPATGTIKDSN